MFRTLFSFLRHECDKFAPLLMRKAETKTFGVILTDGMNVVNGFARFNLIYNSGGESLFYGFCNG